MIHGHCVSTYWPVPCPSPPRPVVTLVIAKTGLLLSRGREDFPDFESSVLRLKSTHVADCKPQAPPGRRWDFALELGYGRFLQIKLGPAKSLHDVALESGPRATTSLKFFKTVPRPAQEHNGPPTATSMHVHEASVLRSFAREWC
jgi:hypothetical protein